MNRFFKCALAALPVLMLASCAEDELAPDAGIAQKTETRYLSVTLSSADATPVSRAEGEVPTEPDWNEGNSGSTHVVDGQGDYQDGSLNENQIKTLEFYFYDKFKNFHSYKQMTLSQDTQWDKNKDEVVDPSQNVHGQDGTENPNIAGFYHCNVPVEIIQGETYPQYVLCIINSVQGSQYQNKPMRDAQATILDRIYGGKASSDEEDKYFGMNNSVYYGRDVVTGEENALIMATPIATEMLKTEDEIQKLTENGGLEDYTVNIYVERYAAKVNLDLGGSEATKTPITDYQTGNATPVELEFNPLGWGLNAMERSFYFIKAFRQYVNPDEHTEILSEPALGEDYESYNAMCGYLFKGWNSEAHHRSFWSRTPGYYANSYPITADDITDKDPVTGERRNTYTVDYLSWKDIMNETKDDGTPNPNYGAFSGKYKYSKYTRETTMMENRLTGEGMPSQYLPTASLPSVILIGEYKVKGKDGGKDLYAYGKNADGKAIFYANETDAEGLGLQDIETKMIDDQTILLQAIKDGDKIIDYITYEPATIGNLKNSHLVVKHPDLKVRNTAITGPISSEAATNELKVAADVAVLQLTGACPEIYFYNSSKSDFEQVTADNINIVNRLLLQNLGGAHLYKEGKAFFTAPIFHWGWYRKAGTKDNGDAQEANPNNGKPMNQWDWTKMQTGDFGIVRNHVYTMKIGEIKGLGTGIPDPETPIVPPADKLSYEVHFHVNIQRWAVLPMQTWNW